MSLSLSLGTSRSFIFSFTVACVYSDRFFSSSISQSFTLAQIGLLSLVSRKYLDLIPTLSIFHSLLSVKNFRQQFHHHFISLTFERVIALPHTLPVDSFEIPQDVI